MSDLAITLAGLWKVALVLGLPTCLLAGVVLIIAAINGRDA